MAPTARKIAPEAGFSTFIELHLPPEKASRIYFRLEKPGSSRRQSHLPHHPTEQSVLLKNWPKIVVKCG